MLNSGGKPRLQVEYKNEEKTFTPEEVSSMVLVKMKVRLDDVIIPFSLCLSLSLSGSLSLSLFLSFSRRLLFGLIVLICEQYSQVTE